MVDDVIQLFFCVDATSETPMGQPADVCATGKDVLDRAFRRMEAFVRRAQSDRMEEIEESQPARELAQLIKEVPQNHLGIELHAVTTGTVSDRAVSVATQGELRREIWDLVRLERVCGSLGDGSITINFLEEFGAALPCLVTPQSADGLQVMLTCIPGAMLAQIYNTHRASLLERNVRSFLQFTGKVNSKIRSTVLNEPHRFLPYNNGLSATAGHVEVEKLTNDLGKIRVVEDFQIVNGGQTTATLASCLRRNADLSAVSVPMKLTVVPGGMLDGLVPQISKYANTQNRIQDSDFSANDPWHIEIERLSRATWTRATPTTPRGTRWFYERARGQYSDALSSCATPAGRKIFRIENPSAQKFTKTDLAKFILSWDQFPQVVSRGSQKCFGFFMDQFPKSQRRVPGETDFKLLTALAILFRCIEKLYDEMGFQGFRANVMTYSMARLSHDCCRQLEVDAIWKNQAVPEHLVNALKFIIPGVRDVIANPPSSQRNVTEWCKKNDCWTAVLERSIQTDLESPAEGKDVPLLITGSESTLSADQKRLVDLTARIPANVWYSISNWAKTTSKLQSWQRSLAYSLGRITAAAKSPSIKQSVQGRNLLLEAVRLGFRHDDLLDEQIESLHAMSKVSS